jgi:crossover junction endodeoxyribonuclease RusA
MPAIRDILITGRSAGAGIARLLNDSQTTTDAPRSPATTLGASGGELRLELPWPPSINHYWRRHGHVIHVSTAGTRFARLCCLAVRAQFHSAPINQPVAVLVEAWAPKRGPYGNCGYDVDNRLKPLLDALTKAELWTDDKFVRDLRIVDRGRSEGGMVVVWVRPIDAWTT